MFNTTKVASLFLVSTANNRVLAPTSLPQDPYPHE